MLPVVLSVQGGARTTKGETASFLDRTEFLAPILDGVDGRRKLIKVINT